MYFNVLFNIVPGDMSKKSVRIRHFYESFFLNICMLCMV